MTESTSGGEVQNQPQDDDQPESRVSPSDENKDSSPAAAMQDNTVGTTSETSEETDTRGNQDQEG